MTTRIARPDARNDLETSSLSCSRNAPDPAHGHAVSCVGCLDRRQVLRAGLVTAGVAAAGVLAACGGGGSTGDGTASEHTGGGSGALAEVADVPEGGAVSVEDADGNALLLTQASAGTIVALSAVCTHQGCTVEGDGAELVCPCHGSVFDLSGANVSGPAPRPLSEVDVHVVDGHVRAGKAQPSGAAARAAADVRRAARPLVRVPPALRGRPPRRGRPA